MGLPNIFSRRKRSEAAISGDVYQYDILPPKMRNQIIQIWSEAIGTYGRSTHETRSPATVYDTIVDMLRKEKGLESLHPVYAGNKQLELFAWFRCESDMDSMVDAIEISFWMIDNFVRENEYYFKSVTSSLPDNAIAELNARLLEAQVGYQYVGGEILKIDSLLIHKEVVLPVLTLLSDVEFAGAEKEFRGAHKLFREQSYELCLTECCKSFESVLKVIANKRDWPISSNDTAGKLLAAAFANNLVPSYLQSEFSGLRTVLESGISSVRNKDSGHGTGVTPRSIPEHLAAFQLHQTATAILFLVQADKAMP
ncbi:STM4504/CBY_0614 family protein [Glacieibacterium megasporae]|uniref:STM4504/CBY_0614 family protein n=1 Tax=Glacieibacterium megasporae TaxID=2835787 RepID=UPI001C1E25CD|nr:hypothetical protein [Polymorphobacter megasporae]UAJ09245.1 hypothetical protein KTC28_13015 [Polymorphobacter megasporae]